MLPPKVVWEGKIREGFVTQWYEQILKEWKTSTNADWSQVCVGSEGRVQGGLNQ